MDDQAHPPKMTIRKRQIFLFFSSEIFLGRFSTEIDDLGLILDDQAQPMGRRRQQDLFPRGFTTMTRVVVVVVAVAVAVAVVVVPIRAVVYAKIHWQAQAARFVPPGLYNHDTRSSSSSSRRSSSNNISMSNRVCKNSSAGAGSKICFPGALQNYHSETSDFLSFFHPKFSSGGSVLKSMIWE